MDFIEVIVVIVFLTVFAYVSAVVGWVLFKALRFLALRLWDWFQSWREPAVGPIDTFFDEPEPMAPPQTVEELVEEAVEDAKALQKEENEPQDWDEVVVAFMETTRSTNDDQDRMLQILKQQIENLRTELLALKAQKEDERFFLLVKQAADVKALSRHHLQKELETQLPRFADQILTDVKAKLLDEVLKK